jgi:hypothetical protein
MSPWDGNEVAGPVRQATSLLADRAQSECARSMRTVEADPLHRPAGVCKSDERERDRPRSRAVLAQRAREDGARRTRAVALNLGLSRGV